MNTWMDGFGWMGGWMGVDGRTALCMIDEYMDGWIWMDGWVYGWSDGRADLCMLDEYMDGWMHDRWMDE